MEIWMKLILLQEYSTTSVQEIVIVLVFIISDSLG